MTPRGPPPNPHGPPDPASESCRPPCFSAHLLTLTVPSPRLRTLSVPSLRLRTLPVPRHHFASFGELSSQGQCQSVLLYLFFFTIFCTFSCNYRFGGIFSMVGGDGKRHSKNWNSFSFRFWWVKVNWIWSRNHVAVKSLSIKMMKIESFSVLLLRFFWLFFKRFFLRLSRGAVEATWTKKK